MELFEQERSLFPSYLVNNIEQQEMYDNSFDIEQEVSTYDLLFNESCLFPYYLFSSSSSFDIDLHNIMEEEQDEEICFFDFINPSIKFIDEQDEIEEELYFFMSNPLFSYNNINNINDSTTSESEKLQQHCYFDQISLDELNDSTKNQHIEISYFEQIENISYCIEQQKNKHILPTM